MLLNLHIENVAIIDKSDIEFGNGFNVLTGETGAGKSIIIGSIGLVTGAKGSKELIGSHGDTAFVSAVFTGLNAAQLKSAAELGVTPDEDGNIIISRKIGSDGRSIAKVNGCPVNVTLLKQLSPLLVSIHGQHDGVKMLDPSTHIEYLDEYAGIEACAEKYRKKYETVKALRHRIDELKETKDKKDQLEAALKFKIGELEKADLKSGEYVHLKSQREAVQNSALLSAALNNADALLLRDDGAALERVSEAARLLESIAPLSPQAKSAAARLTEIKANLEDTCETVGRLVSEQEEIDYTPEYIENRLYTIENAVKKYGTEEDAIKALEEYKNELLRLEDNEAELENAMADYRSALSELEKEAGSLSDIREKSALRLSESVCSQLRELDMPHVSFKVKITRNVNSRGGNKYTPLGFDCVEFLISANTGTEPRPIVKIASGGELSRIMLCLKSALNSEKNDSSTVVYDEIDSGVSGATAQKIGKKLHAFSGNRQVFCITHLAQIAALADKHYRVEKTLVGDRTRSTVRLLSEDERRTEVARIMGGENITDQLIRTADELIRGVN